MLLLYDICVNQVGTVEKLQVYAILIMLWFDHALHHLIRYSFEIDEYIYIYISKITYIYIYRYLKLHIYRLRLNYFTSSHPHHGIKSKYPGKIMM